ncbi:MAG: hypothetical protein ACK40L_03150 [Hydrogenophaga sp.]
MTTHSAENTLTSTPQTLIRSNRSLSAVRAASMPPVDTREKVAALVALGRELKRQDYTWICPSAETHAMVNGRFANRRAHNLTDLFGWNREGSLDMLARLLPAPLIVTLCNAGILQITDGDTARSRVRFSSVADTLLAHSAWPAREIDAVIVGPETQRFAAFIARELQGPSAPVPTTTRPFTLVEVGCGSGAAGIHAARLMASSAGAAPVRVLLTDRQPRALRFAEVNARLASLPHVECRHSDLLAAVSEPPMLVLANTPGLIDAQGRTHLNGGGVLGTGLALRTVDECLDRLLPGGSLLMCALAPVVRGVDVLRRSVEARMPQPGSARRAGLRYEVLDPDVLGSQLAHPAYVEVERLALVGLTVHLPVADASLSVR